MIIVTTPATSHDIVSFERAKQALEGCFDNDLSDAIKQVSGAIAQYCNRVFGRETVEETFRLSTAKDDLVLARYPVASVVSVTEFDTVLDAADYELHAASGVLTRLRNDEPICWSAGKIVVKYVVGYDLPHNGPDALARATIFLAQYFLRSPVPLLKSTDIPGVMSRTYRDFPEGAELPPEVEALVSGFRMPAIG